MTNCPFPTGECICPPVEEELLWRKISIRKHIETPKARQSTTKKGGGFSDIQFIGWDGEGITPIKLDGATLEELRANDWTEKQKLVLLAVSTGETLYDENGLSLTDRLEFIRKIGKAHPKATHVFFGGSYDFNKILEGLPAELVDELHESKMWVRFGDEWIFRYRPRKELTIAHLKPGVKFEAGVSAKTLCDSYVRLWDVIGFFQTTFIQVVEKWLGKDYVDYELIASGKIERLSFTFDQREFMIRYNAAEVKALVEIMYLLHTQLERLGLRISRWDGAGAIAAEIFKRYRLTDSFFEKNEGEKATKIELEPPIEEACRYAFFGGRIESGYIGRHKGPICNYDICSAYPFAASQLPNLNHGKWVHHTGAISHSDAKRMDKMTLFRVRFYFHNDRLYYPFPYRTMGGSVIFPKRGERWIMGPEVLAAIETVDEFDQVLIFEAWEFQSEENEESTFEIIKELYAERQAMVAQNDPAEYPLKLGINSVYGKLCQKLGWNESEMTSPRYHFLLFGAWITSYIRAMIYAAVCENMEAVISINTDGLITNQPLSIVPTETKEFGKWTLKMGDEILQLQSGVYWIRTEEDWEERARGLGRVIGDGDTPEARKKSKNKKIMERIEQIEVGWRTGENKVFFPVKLFITSKKARSGPKWFDRWGDWYIMHDEKTGRVGRALEIKCTGWGKRRLLNPIIPNRLTATIPSENVEWTTPDCDREKDNPKTRDLGEPYDLPWLTNETPEDFESDDDLAEI